MVFVHLPCPRFLCFQKKLLHCATVIKCGQCCYFNNLVLSTDYNLSLLLPSAASKKLVYFPFCSSVTRLASYTLIHLYQSGQWKNSNSDLPNCIASHFKLRILIVSLSCCEQRVIWYQIQFKTARNLGNVTSFYSQIKSLVNAECYILNKPFAVKKTKKRGITSHCQKISIIQWTAVIQRTQYTILSNTFVGFHVCLGLF